MHHVPIAGPAFSGDLAALMVALFLSGLAGSLTHCGAMCGPFVIAQVGAALDRSGWGPSDYGTLTRLRGAALVPYHLGRMTTYAALGAVAAGMVGFLGNLAGFRMVAALALTLAAVAMMAQAIGRGLGLVDRLLGTVLPGQPPAFAHALLADPGGWRGYALGVVLGFLPCGLIYAAVAGASAAGDPVRGALAMAAFAAGTAPGLIGIGWAGALFGRRWKTLARVLAPCALLLAAALLLATAWRLVAG